MKLKELLAHWNASISEQKRRFSDDADFVRRWDAQLRGSMVDLYHLETGVGELEQTCELIDRNLSEMEQNQVNIDTKLRKLEERMEVQLPQNRATGSYMDPTNTYQGAAQLARAQAYDAAIELGTLLDSLEDALDDVEQRVRLGQLEDNMHPVSRGGCGALLCTRSMLSRSRSPTPPSSLPTPLAAGPVETNPV